MYLVLIIVAIVIVAFIIKGKSKFLKLDAVTMINGGVKCGKTSLAVHLALKTYRKNLIRYYIGSKVFRKKMEKPLLYSNIPLKCNYVPLTKSIIERKERMNYKSVVLLSESSLVIDSMSFKDGLVNERVSLFIKLFGHETRGGSMFIETQSINDNHYAVKRCINKTLWIHSLIKVIPFFLVFRVREMAYSDEGNPSTINVFNEDVDNSLKLLIVSKRVWKKFDCYCYSSFTDNLAPVVNVVDKKDVDDLKVAKIVSFKDFKTIPVDKLDGGKK